jgi:hypothetical protein
MYAEAWDNYHEACLTKAGFRDKLIPYLNGSSFYNLADVSDDNLTKLVIDHTQGMREGEYEREQAVPFFGGYVLKVDGQDKYFPQCCADLSDIHYWERLASGIPSYSEGHPNPKLDFDNGMIIFDFTVSESDEHFQPTPPETILTIDISALKIAVDRVKEQLTVFQKRLVRINHEEDLNISNIGDLLIWGD